MNCPGNYFWVLEISCILCSPKMFKTRKHLILQKITWFSFIGPKVLPLPLSYSIAWFHNMIFFHNKMDCGSGWNYPFGSTYNKDQSITWPMFWTYHLSNETWKRHRIWPMEANQVYRLLVQSSQGYQRACNIEVETWHMTQSSRKSSWDFMCKYTCSPTRNSLNALCRST